MSIAISTDTISLLTIVRRLALKKVKPYAPSCGLCRHRTEGICECMYHTSASRECGSFFPNRGAQVPKPTKQQLALRQLLEGEWQAPVIQNIYDTAATIGITADEIDDELANAGNNVASVGSYTPSQTAKAKPGRKPLSESGPNETVLMSIREKQDVFLRCYAEPRNTRDMAASMVHVTRTTIKNWMSKYPDFAERMNKVYASKYRETMAKVIDCVKSGMSIKEAADAVGLQYNTLRTLKASTPEFDKELTYIVNLNGRRIADYIDTGSDLRHETIAEKLGLSAAFTNFAFNRKTAKAYKGMQCIHDALERRKEIFIQNLNELGDVHRALTVSCLNWQTIKAWERADDFLHNTIQQYQCKPNAER